MIQLKNHKIDEQKNTGNNPFPFVLKSEGEFSSEKEFIGWVKENKSSLRKLLLENNSILFRNFPIKNAEAFEQMLDSADFPRMGYVGGCSTS